MNTRLVVVGAGGFGREVISWLTTSPRWMSEHGVTEIVAIDDGKLAVKPPVPIVSTVRGFEPQGADIGICAIGSPTTRRAVVTELESRGLVFPSFVHDSVIVGNNVSIAEGAVVCPLTVLTSDIHISKHVHVNCMCVIGHDVNVGSFATLSPTCNLAGASRVEEGAFLGTAVTVIPGKTIGAGSYVGAGSVVVKDVPGGTLAFGNPAVVRRKVES